MPPPGAGHHGVANLPGIAAAGHALAVAQHGTGNAGANDQDEHVCLAHGRAELEFRLAGHADVVPKTDGQAQGRLKRCREWEVLPPQVGRVDANAGVLVNNARNGDAHGADGQLRVRGSVLGRQFNNPRAHAVPGAGAVKRRGVALQIAHLNPAAAGIAQDHAHLHVGAAHVKGQDGVGLAARRHWLGQGFGAARLVKVFMKVISLKGKYQWLYLVRTRCFVGKHQARHFTGEVACLTF